MDKAKAMLQRVRERQWNKKNKHRVPATYQEGDWVPLGVDLGLVLVMNWSFPSRSSVMRVLLLGHQLEEICSE